MPDISNEDLLAQLGAEVEVKKKAKLTPREERIIAGFEEIQRFVEDHGCAPTHGEEKEIFERLYATRLDQIKNSEECRAILEDLDHQSLLTGTVAEAETQIEFDSDEELLAELGIEAPKDNDITHLKHVKSQSEKERAKSEVTGQRKACVDFDKFKPLFESVQEDIKSGRRKTLAFAKDGSIEEGNLFIVSGQKAYIARVGDAFIGTDGRNEYRLRVIFDNGVESNQLMHSLQKRLWEDENGRRITDMSMGPLFDEGVSEVVGGYKISNDAPEYDDQSSGTIYVLRSESELDVIVNNREVIHKIGVTGGKVEKRIANAKDDATYLLAEVKVVATYPLFGINRNKLEKLIHRFFDQSRLDIEINDRFGKPVKPREWFLVPLHVIDELVDRIKDGSVEHYQYDVKKAKLVQI